MRGFLEEVAADLYARYGTQLGERALCFPSRRARLFFTDALARIAEQPIWQPRWMSVADIMTEISGLHTADRLRLIAELYKVYAGFHAESFDKFYFWGDMLLTDFDTIDKYRVDAQMLFRNIADIKLLEDDISYLTPAQLRIVQFWASLGNEDDRSPQKRRFVAIWQTLGPIYARYRERLTELDLAYEGMVQRAVAEAIDAGEARVPAPGAFAIVGFNALTVCERRLFDFLSTAAQTDFYWDYDTYYKDNAEQEAGMFVRGNVERFPARAVLSHDNMRTDKEVVSVAAVSNAVQCKYAGMLLAELTRRHGALGTKTAVVLMDENLLIPLLHALPAEVGRVNVTMGFALRQSLAYTFVERLVELQHHRRKKGAQWTFYHVDVAGILAHPYVAGNDAARTRKLQERIVAERRIAVDATMLGANALLRSIFRPAASWRELSDYLAEVVAAVAREPCTGDDARQRVEFLAVIAEELARLRNTLEGCDIDLTTEIYASLLRRHLQTLRIPFEGEPLEGIQVMGLLETRNLDFENVILLSMSDDKFPGNHTTQPSFIPYNLRAAYDLPTPEYHEGVAAYHFYRLIQRASRVYMLYCAHADDKTTGEPSRYIHQLDYESPFAVRKVEVGVDVNLARTPPIEVAKDAAVMERLERFVDPEQKATLSPTAFFRYVACPLRFYFHSIARLQTDDQITEEVDAPMFGTILHAAAQALYARIVGQHRPGEMLRAMLRSGEVAAAVEAAINAHYLQDEGAMAEDYSGDLLLVREIVVRYLQRGVMPYDAAHDAFSVAGIEQRVELPFAFEADGRALRIKFAGIVDRVDTLDDGVLRVVDYKTGAAHLDFDGIESLFTGAGKQRLSNIIQTLLYAMMLHHTRHREVEPALYYVRQIGRDGYSPQLEDKQQHLRGARYTHYGEQFEALVRTQLTELYDPSVPFRQCEDADTCKYCDFRIICKR